MGQRSQVRAANEKSVNYIGFGPVFPTTTKEKPEPVTGVDGLCRAVKLSVHPVVAIGGIDAKNVADVMPCRPSGIAVVRAIFEEGDPFENARNLRAGMEGL